MWSSMAFYAQLARRFLAVNDFVDVNDMTILRIAGIRRSCWIHQTLPAVYEVLGGNRLAVRPFCIFTQMEGPALKSLLSQLSATPGIGWPSFGEVFSKPSNRSRLILASGTPSILFGSVWTARRRYYVPGFASLPAAHQPGHPLPLPYCWRSVRIALPRRLNAF